MARIEVEIEDYLDEVDTKYLVQELKKRKDNTENLSRYEDFEIPSFKNSSLLLLYIKKCLGLRQWHDINIVIETIKSL
jgi:hypothetical protein